MASAQETLSIGEVRLTFLHVVPTFFATFLSSPCVFSHALESRALTKLVMPKKVTALLSKICGCKKELFYMPLGNEYFGPCYYTCDPFI